MKFQRIEKPGSMPQSPHQFSLLAHWELCTCLFFCWAVLGSRLKKSRGSVHSLHPKLLAFRGAEFHLQVLRHCIGLPGRRARHLRRRLRSWLRTVKEGLGFPTVYVLSAKAQNCSKPLLDSMAFGPRPYIEPLTVRDPILFFWCSSDITRRLKSRGLQPFLSAAGATLLTPHA